MNKINSGLNRRLRPLLVKVSIGRMIASTLLVLSIGAVDAADLEMRIVWQGALPSLPQIKNPFECDCQNIDFNTDRQFVDRATKGVRDVVVHVSPLNRDRETWRQPPRNASIRVEVKNCRIHPHIVVAQTGDKLRVVRNDESDLHHLNFLFVANPALGAYIPGEGEHIRELRSAEPAAVPIRCKIHPWEKAFLFALDHRYIGASDREGNLVIRGLPANTEVPLRFFHHHGTIYTVRISGQRKELKNGRLIIRVDRTATELGDVLIDAESFTKPESENE